MRGNDSGDQMDRLGNMHVLCILCCCQGKVSIVVELMIERGRGRIWTGRGLVGDEDFGWLVHLMMKCEWNDERLEDFVLIYLLRLKHRLQYKRNLHVLLIYDIYLLIDCGTDNTGCNTHRENSPPVTECLNPSPFKHIIAPQSVVA